jgi:hypothetical protein
MEPCALHILDSRVGRVRRACEWPEYLDGCGARRNPTLAVDVGLRWTNPTYHLPPFDT